MALDWSGYQIPAYLASKDMAESAQDVGSALGNLILKGTTRQDVETQNISEALRGKGRSYYEDKVDKSLYGSYGEWVKEDGGRFLQLAEAGGQMQNVGGEWQIQTPEGEWKTLGTEGDDGVWDPYAGGTDLNPFEKEMRESFMGDWAGGQYTYRTPKSALEALFSKERYKPVSNLYQYDAKSGLQSRFDKGSPLNPNMINFAAIQGDKANLGWYPGKFIPKNLRSSDNVLGKYINKIFGDPSANKQFQASNKQVKKKEETSNTQINVSGHNAYYTFNPDGSKNEHSIEVETSFGLKDKGINQEEFARLYKEHVDTAVSSLTAEEFAQYLITGKIPSMQDKSQINNNNPSAWDGSDHQYQGSSFNVSGKGHSLRQK